MTGHDLLVNTVMRGCTDLEKVTTPREPVTKAVMGDY